MKEKIDLVREWIRKAENDIEELTEEETKSAIKIAEKIKEFVLKRLPLGKNK